MIYLHPHEQLLGFHYVLLHPNYNDIFKYKL